ncbi:hypothetical protein GCM10007933_21860 [Zoogloea oryzae]|uniref:Uncharacterized protein n=1 Tax=Zoogloea oryzae TaxID=310767 RepID=A0ABQ6FDQ2_9RHOO|nr:hypothetical protein GCM10007933_21860 [Zoogloea oryzae]
MGPTRFGNRVGPICPLYLRDCSGDWCRLRAPSVDAAGRGRARKTGGITLQIVDSSAVLLPERFRGLRLRRFAAAARTLSHTTARTLPPGMAYGKGLLNFEG